MSKITRTITITRCDAPGCLEEARKLYTCAMCGADLCARHLDNLALSSHIISLCQKVHGEELWGRIRDLFKESRIMELKSKKGQEGEA